MTRPSPLYKIHTCMYIIGHSREQAKVIPGHRYHTRCPFLRPPRLAPPPQSLAHRLDRHPRHLHGSSGHFHRQRRPPPHRRLSRRQLRRIHLGAYQLPRLQRHHSSHQRLARHPHGPQTLLYVLRRALRRQQLLVRSRSQPRHVDFLSRPARRGGRRPATQRASHPRRHILSLQTRHGLRRVRHGRGSRARDRPQQRRLEHRQLQLALDFLHQRPHQPHLSLPHPSPRGRPTILKARKRTPQRHPR